MHLKSYLEELRFIQTALRARTSYKMKRSPRHGLTCKALDRATLDPNEVRVILDCGANIGITALYFAERYRNARIFCIEADPENFEVLKQNVAGITASFPCSAR